jgi:hypothetical protein
VSESDVAFLDGYVHTAGLASHSAAVQAAIQMLQFPTLEQDYADAWDEWTASGGQADWDATVGDGINA